MKSSPERDTGVNPEFSRQSKRSTKAIEDDFVFLAKKRKIENVLLVAGKPTDGIKSNVRLPFKKPFHPFAWVKSVKVEAVILHRRSPGITFTTVRANLIIGRRDLNAWVREKKSKTG